MVTPKAGKSELWFLCYENCIMVIYICIKFQETILNKLQSGHKYITKITIFKVQRAVTLKVDKTELWFLCSAPRLMMLYICLKFHQNIWSGFQLTEQTRVYCRNDYFQYLLCSKGCNSKSRLTRVTFFCSARCFMVLYICKKFHQNISNGLQLTERT